MGMLRKGAANLVTVVLTQSDDSAYTGLTGATFYVIEAAANDATGTKIGPDGNTDWNLTETATPGTYTGTMPYAAARLLNRHKTYRIIPYKDGVIEGDPLIFSVK